MTWDTTAPADSDFISLGDDAIRTLKTDLQTALRGNAATGTEAIFPGSDTANPVFRYRGLKGTTGARPAFGQYGLYFNTTLNTLQRDSGSAWEDVATLIPSGTKSVFYQASAPVGWTAVAVNDKFLRVVTAGGTGGTTGGGAVTPSTTNGFAHTHGLDDHQHTFYNQFAHTLGGGLWIADSPPGPTGGGLEGPYTSQFAQVTVGAFSSSSHTIISGITTGASILNTASPFAATQSGLPSVGFSYADIIVATKD